MYRKNKVIKIAVSVKMDWHVARHERSEVGENLTRGCENHGFRGVWYDGVGKTCPHGFPPSLVNRSRCAGLCFYRLLLWCVRCAGASSRRCPDRGAAVAVRRRNCQCKAGLLCRL